MLYQLLLFLLIQNPGGNKERSEQTAVPRYAQALIKSYPDHIIGYKNNYIIWKDSSRTLFDDGKKKSIQEILENPDIEDQAHFAYQPGPVIDPIPRYYDPGRIRNETFFKKIYGSTKEEVRKNLVEVKWCPASVNQTLLVTTVNGVDQKIRQISAALDSFPELKIYIQNIAGTFNWRNISGTQRLSAHSFGMTIDINVEQSHYWQWDCKCTDENQLLVRKNKIPQKIVDIFERNGFIWGGKWYHYDTMHFEYRPDLMEAGRW